MSTIDATGNLHRGEGAPGAGQFAGRANSAPTGSIGSSEEQSCATCGDRDAPYRSGGIHRGGREQNEPRFCPKCAAAEAADGRRIEMAPVPQRPAEELTWLVEGDDHEFVTVTARTEGEALEAASASFSDMYDESYGEDILVVIAGFRTSAHPWDDELEWVPGTGSGENEAYRKLDRADL